MRISKADVYKALDKAAANIKKAAGSDGRASRAEMTKALKGLKGTEKALTDMFFRFIDKRDAAPGAIVTKADLDKALTYAKKKLIADYDLDKNGLSDAEVSKMSKTGKLAVALAKEMKAARSGGRVSGGESGRTGGRVSGGESGRTGGRVSGGESGRTGGRVSGGESGFGGRVSGGEAGRSYGGGGFRVSGGE